MNRSSIDNILRGVLCACVIASGCGMEKAKTAKELLKKALVDKKVLGDNSENKKCNDEDAEKIVDAILPAIQAMTLKQLANGLKIKSVKGLRDIKTNEDTKIFDEEYSMTEGAKKLVKKSDYVKEKDLEGMDLEQLAGEFNIDSVKKINNLKTNKGFVLFYKYEIIPNLEQLHKNAKSMNPDDYVKEKDLRGMDLKQLAELGILSVKELKEKTYKFDGFSEPTLFNFNLYVKKEDLEGKNLSYLAETLGIKAVKELKGKTFSFSDDYKATKVDLEDYVRKGDLEKESLFLLGNLYKVGAVEELKGLKTDEGVKIFNDNYEFNDAVKTLVKKENANLDDYINKEDLKKKDLSYLATELKVDAVAKLNELETDEGVKIFDGEYKFNDAVKKLVNKGEEVNLGDYIRKNDLEGKNLSYLAETLGIKSVQDLKGKTFEFNYDCCPKEEINLEDYVKKGNLENYDLTTLAKDLKIKAVGELEGKIFEFYYRENCLIKHEINLNDYVKKLELKNKDLNQLATGFEIFRVQNLQGGTFTFSDNYEATEVDLEGYVRKGDLEKGSLFSLGDLYGVDAVAKLNELETDGGVKIFNNYVFNDEVKGLVKKKDDINLDNYIEKEKLKGLEIDNVKLFNEGNYELTDDAQKLVKKDGYIKKDDVGNDYIEKEKLNGLKIDGVKLFNEEFGLAEGAQTLVNKDGYIKAGDLVGKDLSYLATDLKVGAVEKLKDLQTDGGVKIFNDNYEFNDAVKTLVKSGEEVSLGNYISKNDLKDKTLEQLAGLDVGAVTKLKELVTDRGVQIFNKDYELTDDAKKLVKRETGDTNPTDTSSTTPHAGGCCRYK